MNKLIAILVLAGLGGAILGISATLQGEQTESVEGYGQEEHGQRNQKRIASTDNDIEKLYKLVRQARVDFRTLRTQVGLRIKGSEKGRESRGEHSDGGREGRGEHGEAGREGRGEHREGGRESGHEGRGKHGEGTREGRGESETGEEGGKRLGKNDVWNATRNGAHLILAYDAATQSFKGTVRNKTAKVLSEVRVEVHLSNGIELGPTKRVDLKPGAEVLVELAAADQSFTWWTTHPEHGSEEGHGPGEGEGDGEHGEGQGSRMKNPSLRPLHNQLQLLHREIRLASEALRNRKR